ncbi:MAG: DedA family protein [Geobacteraceae bacterium]|nr:DedA family protein [Geobacteraceae bacterium]
MKQMLLHWIVVYGYPGIFAALLLGIFGAPLPDEGILSFAGYLAFKGTLKLHFAILAATLGSVCGISLSYAIGRSFGLYLVERFGRYIGITPERLGKAHDWFSRYGKWTLLPGFFIPGIRHLIAYLAGTSRLKYSTFSLFAYAGGFLWTTTFVLLGYYMGKDWHRISEMLHHHLRLGSSIVALAILVWFLVRWLQRKFLTKPPNSEG